MVIKIFKMGSYKIFKLFLFLQKAQLISNL